MKRFYPWLQGEELSAKGYKIYIGMKGNGLILSAGIIKKGTLQMLSR